MTAHRCTGDASCKTCFVTPARARRVRVEMDCEWQDAIRAGERPVGSHRLSAEPDYNRFPPPATRPAQRRRVATTPAGLW